MGLTPLMLVNDKLAELLQTLASDPAHRDSLPLQGFLVTILRHKLPYDVFVDKWPQYASVIVKPKHFQKKPPPVYNVCIYSSAIDSLLTLLNQSMLLSYQGVIRVLGVTSHHISLALNDVCKAQKLEMHSIDMEKKLKLVELPANEALRADISSHLGDKYYVAPLDADKHADTVVKNAKQEQPWEKLFFESEDHYITAMKFYIKTGIAIGVFMKASNELVSWGVTNTDLTLLTSTTVPAHRNHGLHKWTLLEMARSRPLLMYLDKEEDEMRIVRRLSDDVIVHDTDCEPCVVTPGNQDDVIESDEDGCL